MEVEDLSLELLLAAGWTGETWSGALDGRPVVVRRVAEAADPFAVARLAREVVALRRVAGVGVPEALRTGRAGGWAYVAVERIDGPDLRAARSMVAATAAEIAHLLAPVAEALARAHRHGIVHRDVAPGNVVIGGRGGVLVDFGACAIDGVTLDGLTPSGWPVAAATPGFTPPEGPTSAEPPRDVWAFGRLLDWCLERFAADEPTRRILDPIGGTCTADAAADRPGMAAVAEQLASLAGANGVRVEAAVRTAIPPSEGGLAAEVPSPATDARNAEMSRIAETLAGARGASRLEVLLVLGRAGIGKSWLVDRAARAAGSVGARVLRARCSEEAGDIRALRGWLDGAARRGDPLVDGFARLTGAGQVDGLGLDVDPERVPILVAQFLGAQGPVLAVLEDLHHASDELLGVLERIPRTGYACGLLVATARPGTVDADDIDGATLPLRGLPADTVRALLAPHGAVDVEAAITAADGNPLAALELAAAARRGEPIEGSLGDLVAARLSEVGADQRGLLLASAAGEVFWPEAIGADLVEAVPELLRSQVIRPRLESEIVRSVEYEWSHPLLREVAYEGFAPEERALGHAEVATGLARWDDADAERVAYHGITAVRLGADSARAVTAEFAGRAVTAAARRASAAAAAGWLDAVREVGVRPDAALRETVGDVATQVGDLDLASCALADALAADRTDPLAVARRMRKAANVLKETGSTDRAARWIERAGTSIRQAAASPEVAIEAVKVVLAAASIAHLRGDRAEAETRARDALSRAEAAGDDELIGRSHLQLEMHASEAGSPERTLHATAALDALARAGEGRALADLRTNLGVSAHDAARFEEAIAHYEAALALADRRSDALGRAIVLNNLAETLTACGRLTEAEDALQRAADLFEASRHRLGAAVVGAARARIALWRGESSRAAELLDATERRYGELTVPVYSVDLDLRWAELAVLVGDAPLARQRLERVREGISTLGDVAVLPHTERRLEGGVLLIEGRTGEAATSLALAAADAERSGVHYEAAMSLAWRARALGLGGDPSAGAAGADARQAAIGIGIGVVPVPAVSLGP